VIVEKKVAGWTDEEFDVRLAMVLRGGVLASALVVLVGGIVYLARHGVERPQYHVFPSKSASFRSLNAVFSLTTILSGRGLIQLGLLLLIATPVARVVFSIIGFVRGRDWLYVAVTLTVLILPTYSLAAG
jgi:uncharacterized membrane protein